MARTIELTITLPKVNGIHIVLFIQTLSYELPDAQHSCCVKAGKLWNKVRVDRVMKRFDALSREDFAVRERAPLHQSSCQWEWVQAYLMNPQSSSSSADFLLPKMRTSFAIDRPTKLCPVRKYQKQKELSDEILNLLRFTKVTLAPPSATRPATDNTSELDRMRSRGSLPRNENGIASHTVGKA